jgi:hypothetical protein
MGGAGTLVFAAAGLSRNNGFPPIAAEQEPLLGSLLDQVALALDGCGPRISQLFARLSFLDRVPLRWPTADSVSKRHLILRHMVAVIVAQLRARPPYDFLIFLRSFDMDPLRLFSLFE